MTWQKLLDIIKLLRSEEGCPWDREQNHNSLIPCLVEECYELIDAIEKSNPSSIQEELGDVLLQVVFHAQIASEQQDFDIQFDIQDVIQTLNDKLIRRHPHVFEKKSSLNALTTREALDHWEKIKESEQTKKTESTSLDSVPLGGPALQIAYRIGKKVSRLGFDWKQIQDVKAKVDEELFEVEQAISEENTEAIEEEIGDLLFSISNYARHLKINPESALRKANQKFVKRFNAMEKEIIKNSKKTKECSEIELDSYWKKIKKIQKQQK